MISRQPTPWHREMRPTFVATGIRTRWCRRFSRMSGSPIMSSDGEIISKYSRKHEYGVKTNAGLRSSVRQTFCLRALARLAPNLVRCNHRAAPSSLRLPLNLRPSDAHPQPAGPRPCGQADSDSLGDPGRPALMRGARGPLSRIDMSRWTTGLFALTVFVWGLQAMAAFKKMAPQGIMGPRFSRPRETYD
jgi:hypothetical protein